MAEHYIYTDGGALKPIDWSGVVDVPIDLENANPAANPDDITASLSTKGGIAIAKNLELRESLFVNRDNLSAYTPDATADDVVVRGVAAAGMTIATDDATSTGRIYFGKTDGTNEGQIVYSHTVGANDSLSMKAGIYAVSVDEATSSFRSSKVKADTIEDNSGSGITITSDVDAPAHEIAADSIRTDEYLYDVLAGDPAAPSAGQSKVYYNSTLDKLRMYDVGATAWVSIDKDDSDDINTIANVGAGAGLVFRDKVANTANLKTIKAGNDITVSNLADEVEISLPENITLNSIASSPGDLLVGNQNIAFESGQPTIRGPVGAADMIISRGTGTGYLRLENNSGPGIVADADFEVGLGKLLKVDDIVDLAGTGRPDFPNGLKVGSITERLGGNGVQVEGMKFVDNTITSVGGSTTRITSDSNDLNLRTITSGNISIESAGGSISANAPLTFNYSGTESIGVFGGNIVVGAQVVPLNGTDLGGTAGTFKSKSGTNLQFRGISGGTGISVVENTNDITISTNEDLKQAWYGPGQLRVSKDNPGFKIDNNFFSYIEFDVGKDVIVQFRLPDDYTDGDDIVVSPYWYTSDTAGNNTWQVESRKNSVGAVRLNTVGDTDSAVVAVPGVANTIVKTDITVAGTGFVSGDVVNFKVELTAKSGAKPNAIGILIQY